MIEAVAALVLLAVLLLFVRTLKGVAARVSRRKALSEFVAGMDLYFKGEYEEARSALASVLERDPENSEARILLGDACRELGDVAEAHKHHYQVAEVFGQDLPRNRLSLGRDLLAMGRPDGAAEHLERAAEADPDDLAVLDLLLTAKLESGTFDDAIPLARRLEDLAEGPAAEAARRRRAAVALRAGRDRVRRGDTREGEKLLKSAIRLNPALVAPRLELVRSSWLHGSSRSAEKELLAQLKEMARLAEDGNVVFEPPGRAAAAVAQERVEALPEPGRESEAPPSRPELPGDAPPALPEPGAARAGPPARTEDAHGVPRGPGAEGAGAVSAGEIPETQLPMDAGAFAKALLEREAAYVCAACGRGQLRFVESCPGCGTFGALLATDGTPLVPVPEIGEIFDEIRENRSFVRKLVARAARGDETAAARLTAAGPRVVSSIFREMLRVSDPSGLVRILRDMGPEAADAILRGFHRAHSFSTRRLVRQGVKAFRSLDGAVVRSFAGMGEPVIPRIERLLEEGDRAERQIALDVLIRLGAADRIEAAALNLSMKEILDRLNACPEEELGRLLDVADPEGYLSKTVLPDRTFLGDRALAGALTREGNRRKMREVLIRRGFSPSAYDAVEEAWCDPGARVMARDVVRSYGRAAADHLIKTYTSPGTPEPVREDALTLFLDLGDEEVERLVERLSEGDPETEKAVLRGVLAFGSRAVPALVRAYGRSGLLQKVGLNRRRLAYRKMTLLRALAQVGTYDAMQGLRQIHDREGDQDLKRRIRKILDRMAGREKRS